MNNMFVVEEEEDETATATADEGREVNFICFAGNSAGLQSLLLLLLLWLTDLLVFFLASPLLVVASIGSNWVVATFSASASLAVLLVNLDNFLLVHLDFITNCMDIFHHLFLFHFPSLPLFPIFTTSTPRDFDETWMNHETNRKTILKQLRGSGINY